MAERHRRRNGRHKLGLLTVGELLGCTARGHWGQTVTWLRVQPARVEELGREVDVDIAEEEQDVAALPEAGTHVQALAPGELSVQLDEGEVPEVGGSGREQQAGRVIH